MEKKAHSGERPRQSTHRLPGDAAGNRISFSLEPTVHLALNASAELPPSRDADRIENVVERTEGVVGNRDEALRWLGTLFRRWTTCPQ